MPKKAIGFDVVLKAARALPDVEQVPRGARPR